MNSVKLIVTHPGGAHKDDFLACCVLLAEYGVSIVRRDPTKQDLEDPDTCVVDVGYEHEPAKRNFDHHQFPRDYVPTCSLSLVLQYFDLYEDARRFCDWLESAEWLDCRGPKDTAEFLGVDPAVINQLNSPIDVTLLRRFGLSTQLEPGGHLWEMMKLVGQDLIDYLRTMHARLEYVHEFAEQWDIEFESGRFKVIYLPRIEPLPPEPSMGLVRYVSEQPIEEEVVGLVYPDRRGKGYGLSRYKDHPSLDFTRIEEEEDVHFAHKKGFVAKVSATDQERLKNLIRMAWQEGSDL